MSHIHEKIDFCAETFIVHKNKVLLRKHDKYKIWLSIGGHIELHEDPNKAAIREVKEEVGLDIKLYEEDGRQPIFKDNSRSLIPPQYLNKHSVIEGHEHIAFVYFASSDTDSLTLSEQEISEECRWFTREDLSDNSFGLRENVRFYALKALEKLS
jgi:8-oxo-dGTP pyrophosphatase MutT (NUDIX family)